MARFRDDVLTYSMLEVWIATVYSFASGSIVTSFVGYFFFPSGKGVKTRVSTKYVHAWKAILGVFLSFITLSAIFYFLYAPAYPFLKVNWAYTVSIAFFFAGVDFYWIIKGFNLKVENHWGWVIVPMVISVVFSLIVYLFGKYG